MPCDILHHLPPEDERVGELEVPNNLRAPISTQSSLTGPIPSTRVGKWRDCCDLHEWYKRGSERDKMQHMPSKQHTQSETAVEKLSTYQLSQCVGP